MTVNFSELLTVTFTLFAVIDVIGSVPILISLKEKMGEFSELKATLISGALMILFLYLGKEFLRLLGVDIRLFRSRRFYRDIYPWIGNGAWTGIL